jgi:hypothetical protein
MLSTFDGYNLRRMFFAHHANPGHESHVSPA